MSTRRVNCEVWDKFDPERVTKSDMDYGRRTYKETPKKGDKDTFYCQVCRTELNSRETMQSHVSGARHRQRLDAECRTRREREEAVKRIPNPTETKKKKIPDRLEQLLTRTGDPVVGLKFISEYLPVSNDEMEPHYECALCQNQGKAGAMFSHILARDHRAR